MSHAPNNTMPSSVEPTHETAGPAGALALGTGSPFFGATLTIEYHRISPNDKSGMVNIDCDGPQGWHYADIGSHRGAQVCEGVDAEKVHTFGAALSRLVKEHFGAVRPLLDHDVPRKRRANTELRDGASRSL